MNEAEKQSERFAISDISMLCFKTISDGIREKGRRARSVPVVFDQYVAECDNHSAIFHIAGCISVNNDTWPVQVEVDLALWCHPSQYEMEFDIVASVVRFFIELILMFG